MTDERPKKRRRTRRVSEAGMGLFVRKYARRAHRGHDPNDRSYDRNIEKKIKRMKAEDVDRLLRGEES